MRKRLFIFAAATCFALSAFATPAFAEESNLTEEPTIVSEAPGGSDGGSSNEESYSGEGQTNPSVAGPVVAKIGDTKSTYTTLQEAITATCSDTTSNKATITLQSDLELNNEGLRFDGPKVSTPDEWKDITIDAANKYKLTLNDLGIYAAYCKVTIQNCPELTVKAGTNPGNTDGETSNISAVLFCPGTLILDECKTVNITNPEPTKGGSGLCIYNGRDLYIQNNTHLTVSGFMNRTPVKPGEEGKGGCSGIYIDSDKSVNNDYATITGQIVVSNNSTLTATNCFHNGITANPVNITVTGNSTIDVNNNNNDGLGNGLGKGGIGCYYSNLTVTNSSHVTASKNTGFGYAIFVNDLYVDKSSGISAVDNGEALVGGYGITIGGHGIVEGSLTASGSWGPGVAVYYDDEYCSLTVKDGGQITSCDNYGCGIANDSTFTVEPGATVTLQRNLDAGLDNYPAATTTVEENANFIVTDNYGVGIKNGNNKDYKDKENKIKFTDNAADIATLNLKSGLITENHTNTSMPFSPTQALTATTADYGAGICNQYGNIDISAATKIYNNHAGIAGDDLYNYKNDGAAVSNNFTITVVPGANGCVLHDGKYIDYWYKDGNGTPRWDEVNAIRYPGGEENMTIPIGLGEALKAAHDINAKKYEPPKPSPDPKPEPSPEPKPSPEPSPEPTVTPTPAPSASPAPTAAPTTAPADNTATAAPATPAPTAQPTVTATPAPTAQASGVIPQTGDSSSPALFSILTLGSITALCVLQKRRKSK